MDDEERLEGLRDALDRLQEMTSTHVLLVEGRKDVVALEAIGVIGDVFCVQSGGGPVKAAEYAWRVGKPAVILTDWDRRGCELAQSLRENLSSLDVDYDDRIRSDLSFYARPFSKDVESLDSVIGRLCADADLKDL